MPCSPCPGHCWNLCHFPTHPWLPPLTAAPISLPLAYVITPPAPPLGGAPGTVKSLGKPSPSSCCSHHLPFSQHLFGPRLSPFPLHPLQRHLPFLKQVQLTQFIRAMGTKGRAVGGVGSWGYLVGLHITRGAWPAAASRCPAELTPTAQPLPPPPHSEDVWQPLPQQLKFSQHPPPR